MPPAHYGDPEDEYRALRAGAALIDLTWRSVVIARGGDRQSFLQGMLTNEVASLAPGSGCAALLLTVQGRPVADVRVAVTADAVLLEVERERHLAFVAALEALLIADDVELEACDPPVRVLGLEGPGARACVGSIAEGLAPWAHVVGDVGGVPCRVQRASLLDDQGVVVYVPASEASRVWDALVVAGAHPCGVEAFEGRRIELARPRIGIDTDDKTLVLEIPMDETVSFTKGCYLGQEVVARGTARGHVNRRLVLLQLEGPPPPPGTSLVRDGKEVGHVTSVARAYGAGTLAALGFVRREHWDVGTSLAVRHGHAVTMATVMRPPLA